MTEVLKSRDGMNSKSGYERIQKQCTRGQIIECTCSEQKREGEKN